MPRTETLGNCTYIHHDNGIHEFILGDNSRQTFEDNLILLQRALDAHPLREPFREILYLQGGAPPISYTLRRTQNLLRSRAETPHIRAALLHEPGIVISLAQPFLDMLRISYSWRFFQPEQHDLAVQWLLEDE